MVIAAISGRRVSPRRFEDAGAMGRAMVL